MSLQVWLPLTKDTRQQGLSNITVTNTGATYSSTGGKLGGCYSFDGTKYLQSSETIGESVKELTFACWVCPGSETLTSGQWYRILGIGSHTRAQLDISSDNKFRLFVGQTGSTSGLGVSSTTVLQADIWYHICGVLGNNYMAFYVNGNRETYSTIDSSSITYTNADYFRVGTINSGNLFRGKLNDVRYYDHALSQMEVKELAKGLVLHYPLNRQGWGQDNHFRNSNFTNGTNSWYGVNSSSIRVETKDGRLCGTGTKGTSSYIIGQTSAAYTGGTTVDFTISAKVYVSEAGTITISNWITTTQASGWQSMSGTRIWNTSSNLSVGWNYISTTLKNATNQYTGNIVTAFNYTGTTFWITDIKFEFGDKATPWCPNSSDELATTMGLNSTIEYDCSGFGNNGTRTGTFSWTSDTPKYNVSTNFDGSGIRIQSAALPVETQTISVWAKTTKDKNTAQCILGDSASGICMFIYGGGLITYFRGSSGGAGSRVTFGSEYKENDWNHLVVVKTGDTTRDAYCNGVKLATAANNFYTHAEGFWVGVRNANNQLPFYGQICDVRAYATALSADDIKSLYQNSAYIDNSGNVYGAVYEEV